MTLACHATGPDTGAEQILDLHAEPRVQLRGEPLAVAVGGVALVAQQAERAAGFGERGQFLELVLRLRRLEMALVDASIVSACPLRAASRPSLGVPSFCRCT